MKANRRPESGRDTTMTALGRLPKEIFGGIRRGVKKGAKNRDGGGGCRQGNKKRQVSTNSQMSRVVIKVYDTQGKKTKTTARNHLPRKTRAYANETFAETRTTQPTTAVDIPGTGPSPSAET